VESNPRVKSSNLSGGSTIYFLHEELYLQDTLLYKAVSESCEPAVSVTCRAKGLRYRENEKVR